MAVSIISAQGRSGEAVSQCYSQAWRPREEPEQRTILDVSNVPIATDAAANSILFDHIVGAGNERRGDRQAECLGGLEI
jgi:hypothetical protein